METLANTCYDYAACLEQKLGRKATPEEYHKFVQNQCLLDIYKRDPLNAACHITFSHATNVKLLKRGELHGDRLQLHSYDGKHRFYSVLLEEQGEEDVYLFLNATIETMAISGAYVKVVQSVQLITIDTLILKYNPTTFD